MLKPLGVTQRPRHRFDHVRLPAHVRYGLEPDITTLGRPRS